MSLGGHERWERITRVLLWTGVGFVVLGAYRVYDGDDFWGVAMTLAPGAICLALWKLISSWLDDIVSGGKRRWIMSTILVGLLVVVGIASIAPRSEVASQPAEIELAPDLEVVDLPLADGGTVKSLARKSHREDCAKWVEVPSPSGDRMVGYCADR